MLFLSFLASLSPLAFSRPMYIFVGPVTHYSYRLGLMGFLLFILSILCGPHYWALLSAGLPQMALNKIVFILLPGGPSRRVMDPGMTYPSTPFRICNHVEFFLWRRVFRGPTKQPTSLFPNVSYPVLGISNFLLYFMSEKRTTCKIFQSIEVA